MLVGEVGIIIILQLSACIFVFTSIRLDAVHIGPDWYIMHRGLDNGKKEVTQY